MATPYLDEAERCARVALLHDGRLLALDEPSHAAGVAARPAAGGDRRTTPRPPVDVLAGVPGVADVQSFGDRAHVRIAAGPGAARCARPSTRRSRAAGIGVSSVRPIAASLEDVFIDLITAGSQTDDDLAFS